MTIGGARGSLARSRAEASALVLAVLVALGPAFALGSPLGAPLAAQAPPSGTAQPGVEIPPAPTIGPARGAVVAVGGAMASPEIYRRFIELAGGRDALIVLVPTALGGAAYDSDFIGVTAWRQQGARNVVILHTNDRAEAESERFVEPLRRAGGVFFFGGRQWLLAETYGGTRTERELRALLERGGVVGGTSAGASILGSFLVRGDTETNTIVMGDHQIGFGLLRDVAIDQHVLRRNRHFDLIELIEAHPHLLGIGLDEDAALVVQGNRAEVIGSSYALVFDNRTTTGSDGRFYFLAPGDGLDLWTRVPRRPSHTDGPVPNIERRPWPNG
jgi:cyanophycinase